MNGYVTFGRGMVSWYPQSFPLYSGSDVAVLAPFWSDIDLRDYYVYYYYYFYYFNPYQQSYMRNPGRIYYHCYSHPVGSSPGNSQEKQVFDRVSKLVKNYASDSVFSPTMVCVITWCNVPPYPFTTMSTEVSYSHWYGRIFTVCLLLI